MVFGVPLLGAVKRLAWGVLAGLSALTVGYIAHLLFGQPAVTSLGVVFVFYVLMEATREVFPTGYLSR